MVLNIPQLHPSYPGCLGITSRFMSSNLVKHSNENSVKKKKEICCYFLDLSSCIFPEITVTMMLLLSSLSCLKLPYAFLLVFWVLLWVPTRTQPYIREAKEDKEEELSNSKKTMRSQTSIQILLRASDLNLLSFTFPIK